MPVYQPSNCHHPEITNSFPIFRRTGCLEYLEDQAIISRYLVAGNTSLFISGLGKTQLGVSLELRTPVAPQDQVQRDANSLTYTHLHPDLTTGSFKL